MPTNWTIKKIIDWYLPKEREVEELGKKGEWSEKYRLVVTK